MAVVAVSPVAAVAAVVLVARLEEVARVATHPAVVVQVVDFEAVEVEALGHQVRGPLETGYSEVPHLLTRVSRPPT